LRLSDPGGGETPERGKTRLNFTSEKPKRGTRREGKRGCKRRKKMEAGSQSPTRKVRPLRGRFTKPTSPQSGKTQKTPGKSTESRRGKSLGKKGDAIKGAPAMTKGGQEGYRFKCDYQGAFERKV